MSPSMLVSEEDQPNSPDSGVRLRYALVCTSVIINSMPTFPQMELGRKGTQVSRSRKCNYLWTSNAGRGIKAALTRRPVPAAVPMLKGVGWDGIKCLRERGLGRVEGLRGIRD